MPGIVGIINRGLATDAADRQVAAMVECMRHERFYTSGTCSFSNLGIHAGWVAHQESMAANQVFWNEAQDVALLFAGECFVDQEVRSDLKRAGHSVGERAGDWLVHVYEEKGEAFFKSLNGLFSGLLIDLRQQRTYLFNDRYGIERLYWFHANDATYFASEAKALLRVLPGLRTFDEEGLAQFLSFGCTLNWRTLFRDVRLAPGGSLWRIDNAQCRREQYFTPAEWESQPPLSEDAFVDELAEKFARVLGAYFESDRRAGIALTGGFDTRMIMACLPCTGTSPVCYTFAGVTGETRDARLAACVAAACGLEHGLLRIGSDFFSSFGDWLERTVHVTDGCFGATGAHEMYLNALARAKSQLRVTGVFGSEILREVSTFKPVPFAGELVECTALRSQSVSEQTAAWERIHPVTFAAFYEIPWNIQPSLVACRSQVIFRTPFLDNAIVALAYRLPARLRRSSTAASRFIQLLSPRLAAIPTDRGYLGNRSGLSRSVRRAVAEVTFKLDYYYNEGMPQALTRFEPWLHAFSRVLPVFGQHKYLHYRRWFRNELSEYLRAVSRDIATCGNGLWNGSEVQRMAEDHIRGARNRVHDIAQVLTLRAIERRLLQVPS